LPSAQSLKLLSTLDLEPLEHHVCGIDGFDTDRGALGADIGQMMPLEFVAALVAHQRGLDLGQFEFGILDQRDFLFDNIEAELHVVAAVAGERIEPDVDEFYPFGLLRRGLFLNGFQYGANEMNFVHKCLSDQLLQYAPAQA
jgi:hypothetical protein